MFFLYVPTICLCCRANIKAQVLYHQRSADYIVRQRLHCSVLRQADCHLSFIAGRMLYLQRHTAQMWASAHQNFSRICGRHTSIRKTLAWPGKACTSEMVPFCPLSSCNSTADASKVVTLLSKDATTTTVSMLVTASC